MDDDEYQAREADRQLYRHMERERVDSSKIEDDDNNSNWSSEGVSDEADQILSHNPLPIRKLGLSRRTGFTRYDDYDVITVHGARDDPQTAWTSPDDNSDWILDKLFQGKLARQLDFVYDTSDNARIYDPNADGIAIEANALLHSLTQNRIELPTVRDYHLSMILHGNGPAGDSLTGNIPADTGMQTEDDRPIIWICHDLGGSIVKQALVNATYKLPDIPPEDLEDVEYTMDFRRMYRRLPLLTSTIIFLGCPHNAKANEDLVDQLFAMMLLPGPVFRTQAMNKIRNIARQIETVNLEFLESKVSERALIINITSGPEKRKAPGTNGEAQKRPRPIEGELDSDQEADHPFSSYIGQMFPNLGIFYALRVEKIDHLGLVRGSWRDQAIKEGFDWVSYLSINFNTTGKVIKNHFSWLTFQNSLLSLSPPTQVITHTHELYAQDNTNPRVPGLITWIMEHSFFETRSNPDLKPQTLYLHTGNKGHIDIKLVSKQICFAYDTFRKGTKNGTFESHNGCFYFEFDRHDSRRSGIKAMIASFICTLTCRFWTSEQDVIRMSLKYLDRHQSWTQEHLLRLFVIILEHKRLVNMTIILAQLDHLEKSEADRLFTQITQSQWLTEKPNRFIITTTKPLDFICDKLVPQNVMNLSECPLSPDGNMHSEDTIASEDTTQMPTSGRRPRSTQMAPKLTRVWKKINKSSSSQEKLLEEPPNSRPETPRLRATSSVQETPSGKHEKRLRALLEELAGPTEKLMRRVYSWIRHAAEPLTPEILTDAIQGSLPEEMDQLGMSQDPKGFVKFVQKTMRDIIVTEGRDLRFSHEDFYDISGSGMFQYEEKQTNLSHADMATVCLRYLLGSEGQEMLRSLSVENHGLNEHDLNWSPLMLPRHTICSYALRFWTVHYRAAGSYRPTELALELFQDESKLRVWVEAVYVISNPFNRAQREYISPLPYMAMYGLDDLVRRHIQNEGKYNGLNQDHWSAIMEAARNEHRKTVTLLIKHADSNVAGLAEAIDWAASSNVSQAAMDVLISEAQRAKNFCWPPFILDRAVTASHNGQLLSALIKAGYDPNERDSTGEATAVHNAIMLHRQGILEDLLKTRKADLTLKGKFLGYSGQMQTGYSPLACAVVNGIPFFQEMLMEAGAHFYGDFELIDCLMNAVSQGAHRTVAWFLRGPPVPQQYLDECLVIAAQKGFANCARLLLESGADPNYNATSLLSPLYGAIARGYGASLEVCRMLLEKGANANQHLARKDALEYCRDPPTPLILAIVLNKTPMVALLLKHGAKINGRDPDAGTDLPLSAALFRGNMEIVDLLLERRANPNLGRGESAPCANPPLLVACYFRPELRLVDKIIKSGANVRDTVGVDGCSVLHYLARHDNSCHLLPLLLNHGAEINATNDDNFTPLMVAAACGSTKFAELLLKQIDPKPDLEATSTNLRTALHLSLLNGHSEMVKLLVEAGADVDRQASKGQFPLGELLASDQLQQYCEDLLELMLQRKPRLDLANNDGSTVLHHIRSDTPLSVVVRLVVEGAPVNTCNDLGYNPLACAVQCGNTNVARYLTMVRGVQTDLQHPRFGSILHLAAAHSTLDVVRQLIGTGVEHSAVNPAFGESILYSTVGNENKKQLRNIVRYLVEEVGIHVDTPGGRWGCSILRTVVESRGNHLLKYLLNHGARTDHVDFLGRTAVHWAVIKRRLIDLETLVEYGADVSAPDKFRRSPLHFAASKDDLDVLRYLLEKLPDGAANDNAADVDGWTPLMWAARSGSSMAFALIDEYQADTCARSHDAQWSPLRIARFCGWSEKEIEGLKQRAGAQGREEGCLSEDDETKPGERYEQICVGCDMACIGQLWSCTNCETFLCFKCIGHSAKMHDPDHAFGEMEAQLEEEEELGEDVDEIEHEGGSQTGSDGEVQEETESETETESEEEDDDDSEEEDDDDSEEEDDDDSEEEDDDDSD